MTRSAAASLLACAGAVVLASASQSPPVPRSLVSLESRPLSSGVEVGAPVLALAFLPGDRLAVLTAGDLRLGRWRGGALEPLGAWPLPPGDPVRFPGGVLQAGEESVWLLRSGLPRAHLLAADEGGGLLERGQADALPWPASPTGLRYREGTNLLRGTLPGLGDGPFLAAAAGTAGSPALAVDPDGRVLVASDAGPRPAGLLRAGPALVRLGEGLWAAGSAAPPGPADTILLLAQEGDDVRLAGEVPVAGAVRALASSGVGDVAHLVAAFDSPTGATLVAFEVRRSAP